jgi:hypothetical protein
LNGPGQAQAFDGRTVFRAEGVPTLTALVTAACWACGDRSAWVCCKPRAVATPCRPRTRLALHRCEVKASALRARAVMQARSGIEPAQAWQAPRGELRRSAIQHNGLLPKVPQSRAGRAWCGTAIASLAAPLRV